MPPRHPPSGHAPRWRSRYGNKYERGLSRKEVAKRIRLDIKAGVKAGELPKAKYSVRIEQYAGGGSINIVVSDLPFEVLSEARVVADHYNPNRFSGIPWRSDAAAALERALEGIGAAYNRDASDSMVDYFDVDYYLHVDCRYPEGERAAILARFPNPPPVSR